MCLSLSLIAVIMSSDINFDEPKMRSARRGRRAVQNEQAPELDTGLSMDTIGGVTATDNQTPPSAPPRPSRRIAGWGSDIGQETLQKEDSRLGFGVTKETAQSDDDEPIIPVLPDTEDARERTAGEVAAAPNVVVNRVATYRELDTDLLRHNKFLALDNEIDLRLLAKCLSSEADVHEADSPWHWDRLFTEVTSELKAEAGEEEDDKSSEAVQPKPLPV